MKFTAIFFFSLFSLAAMATADAACEANGDSIKSAIAAKTKSATSDIYICAISSTRPSAKAGYVETSVQYTNAGKMFCMREDEVMAVDVTVKGSCE